MKRRHPLKCHRDALKQVQRFDLAMMVHDALKQIQRFGLAIMVSHHAALATAIGSASRTTIEAPTQMWALCASPGFSVASLVSTPVAGSALRSTQTTSTFQWLCG
jgi:hypothetical protein